MNFGGIRNVSTHSRLKAAGKLPERNVRRGYRGFNTQPPEGGWRLTDCSPTPTHSFNTQPPEGGWGYGSTVRSQRKSFNTQPPEGGWLFTVQSAKDKKRFNTQPPEGGWNSFSKRADSS